MTISKAGLWLCHSLQFAVMLTVLTNLTQYYAYLGQLPHRGSLSERYGPFLCVSVASIMLMVHPTIFVLRDLQLLQPMCQYKLGYRIMRACTHIGFLHLFWSALWATGRTQTWPASALHSCCAQRCGRTGAQDSESV